MGYQIKVDGEIIGYTKDVSAFTNNLSRIDAIIQTAYGVDTARVSDDIQINWVAVAGQPQSSEEDFTRAAISRNHDVSVDGVAMIVDGQAVGNFVSKAQAEEAVKEAVKASADVQDADNLVKYEINSDIKMENITFDVSQVKTTQEWAQYLAKGEGAESKAQSAAQDSLMVASRGETAPAPVNEEEIQSLSEEPTVEEGVEPQEPVEEATPETAKPAAPVTSVSTESQTPSESQTASVIKMTVIKESAIKEDIPYEVIRQDDPSLYTGQAKVTQPGQLGVLEKKIECSYQDGVLVSQNILGEAITKEPVPQIISVGTNAFPTLACKDGKFIIAANGDVTSTDKAGSHSGYRAIDIANAQGTPIYAPMDGTVTMTEEYGSYGLTVQIQAQDGTVFLMAHNSAFQVNVGDHVTKGQVIALMGSTGDSSGPHCHFEVRVNGEQQPIPNYFDLNLGDVI